MVVGCRLWERILDKCAMESNRFFMATQRAQSGTGTPDSSGQPHAWPDEFIYSHKLKSCGTRGTAAFERMIRLPELDVEQNDYAHHNQA
jgi:hypothetical protein